ncbi:MAG: phosphoribosylamine--glycine ligase [Immundisolibacter sp.]|uniref:phosphoribosylamine--glycine ligase n=1 Tax=Immundisolibacter sp. TaxID=1934948 RepID=UPI001989C658|nr:phosphoribosylamine--glycine ligase [Immundisolibacter sp.]MBC7162578.1 phosphoribosylamine--glycine ligase [Immundisolibacter sp.]
MKLLVIGSGGREHALAWKLAQSPRVTRVYVAPGNAGTATEPGVQNVAIAAEDVTGLLAFAQREAIDLTVVGPEAPLVAGVVDAFAAAGRRCFGPSRAAAQLEGSKAYAKEFLRRHAIPTAAYETFEDLAAALAHVRARPLPMVIKADGLAAGKGVVIAHRRDEAEAAVRAMLGEGAFGSAGARLVVEDFLVGEEASFIVMVDGGHILPLATSQDHKARDDGDRGPNTGGMGAYSPAPVVTPDIHARIMAQVIEPTVAALTADGTPYTGFLYAGLMIDVNGAPRVLEFNCRLGDPETQPIMLRLRSDLVDLIEAALDGRLDQVQADWDPRPALGVVLAAQGYPGEYATGTPIAALPVAEPPDSKVFHAGTAVRDGQIVTAGGRVVCVTALGDSVAQAQRLAYGVVEQVAWPGALYRRDIGYRAVARERTPG